jgi:hypothetical protein
MLKSKGVIKMLSNDGTGLKRSHEYYSKKEREEIIRTWSLLYPFMSYSIVPKISPAREVIWERIIDECCE